jgi:D-amino-acid dehydrogenase
MRYFLASNPETVRRTFEANLPIFARCLAAHEALMAEAGTSDLITRKGWIKLFRSEKSMPQAEMEAEELRDIGLDASMIDTKTLQELEPHLDTEKLKGAMHYRDPWTCSNPGALVKSYANLFENIGGEIAKAEVSGIERERDGWRLSGAGPELNADHVAVTLGPWSKKLLDDVGLRLPMGIKRGYHRHYAPAGNSYLTRPLLDEAVGYVMAPTARGIRLTSGAEFARHDAPKTPNQLARVLPKARELFPLGESVDEDAWMGSRPVFPDMLPVIGPAPGHDGMWLNFGHAHHGFTLGPVSGELLAQMMTGETPFCDPAPYSAQRFTRAR